MYTNVKMDRMTAMQMQSALTLQEPLIAIVQMVTLVMEKFALVSN